MGKILMNTILISIDHETLGLDPINSIILATGVIIGDTKGKVLFEKEYIYPFLEQLDYGNTIASNTVKWWCSTSSNFSMYKYYMGECSKQEQDMSEVTHELHNDLQSNLSSIGIEKFKADLSINSHNVYMCAKSPKFDIAFLDRLFNDYLSAALPRATFKQDFDFRTIDMLCKNLDEFQENNEFPHSALSDAEYQYKKLIYQLDILDIKL